jgi:hypothetical protein
MVCSVYTKKARLFRACLFAMDLFLFNLISFAMVASGEELLVEAKIIKKLLSPPLVLCNQKMVDRDGIEPPKLSLGIR